MYDYGTQQSWPGEITVERPQDFHLGVLTAFDEMYKLMEKIDTLKGVEEVMKRIP